ncbi:MULTISPECIES: redox-sensing transcriptional repressor Rex [unclassified Arthrobacter]|uniref:redox-sensing transcriptional repressor Rex n=1 Tax=unclassified Arthrobacter TaxID=235627 RepID=UPI00210289F0|nr:MULTISPECIES: redox-sensing transcriptional repressor Rex [unclassified Arthrobacter]MCQ1945782.1 redox-sensing transcriptional repressor Rex [Arthrobacter sp. zg-Y1116]MCQ1994559.1 redox-sensing transcriptional repressor Rex [Arthrobacter sp. zg-Y1171]UWX81359.1 redox-sensing transcriptional repressor Rex [Arthrobacter sp. zg-Y1171]
MASEEVRSERADLEGGTANSGQAAGTSSAAAGEGRHIPPASLARLTIYLRALSAMLADGIERVSSEELAEAAGVNSPKLRKDLSYLGSYGTRGVGYDVPYLSGQISAALGLTLNWRVAIVGAGNLGRALAGYPGFGSRGFEVVALFDADPMVIGQEVGWLRISPVDSLEAVLAKTGANMAVLSVPAEVAQDLCDRLVESGITSILSFAPVVLQAPEEVQIRKVDMATELQILAYHAQRSQVSQIAARARLAR